MDKKKIIYSVLAGIVFLAVALFMYLNTGKKVDVVLYGTSTSAKTAYLEKSLIELKSKFGDQMNLDIIMVSSINADDKILSYNPDPENPTQAQFDIAENQIQHIVREVFPDQYLEYLTLRNDSLADTNSDKYIKAAGIDFDTIKSGLEDGKGRELLLSESERFEKIQKENDIPVIPVLFVNDSLYEGADDTLSLGAAIVKPILRGRLESLVETKKFTAFGDNLVVKSPFSSKSYAGIYECYQDLDCNDKQTEEGFCANVGTDEAFCKYEEASRVDAIVINDEACVSCFTDKATEALKKDFKGLEVREVDLDSDEGRDLISRYKIDGLPVYLFEKNVEEARNFNFYIQNQLLGIISEEDSRYVHTKTEARKLLDRPKRENTLDLFVNAYNPLSIELENKLIELKRAQKAGGIDSFDIDIHHVLAIEVDNEGNSRQLAQTLSGEVETAESVRQAVVAQFFPEKFEEYILKRNQNLERNHEEILEELGISIQSFDNIVDQQGEAALLKSAELAAELTIQSLPVFMWENQIIVLRIEDLKKIDVFAELDITFE